MKRSVFGIVRTREEAETVIRKLKDTGFSSDSISLLLPESSFDLEEHATKAPEGAATGGTTGFILGGVLGWLAGIGSLAIPGVGPFLAAGPIFAALSGAAVGAAFGGITGALIGMGIPEYEARHYESRIREGNILVSIHTDLDVEAEKAREILERSGAEEIAYSGELPLERPEPDRPNGTYPPQAGSPIIKPEPPGTGPEEV